MNTLMDRTFAHRVTTAAQVIIAALTAVALYCFWQRQGAYVVCGALAMLMAVVVVERTVHTTYTLTDDGRLVIDRGRLARQQTVVVGEITRLQQHTACLHLVRYVLVEYGAGHWVAVQPADEGHFIEAIKKRQHEYDENAFSKHSDGAHDAVHAGECATD